MTYSVLVAEPSNDAWTSIANGVRRYRPQAAVLRVNDGEQAMRFLFQRGLLTDAPETPDLIVLAAGLPIVPVNAVIARLRQHPRTQSIPVILMWPNGGREEVDEVADEPDTQQWLHRQPGVIVITGTHRLEKEVAHAIDRLSASA